MRIGLIDVAQRGAITVFLQEYLMNRVVEAVVLSGHTSMGKETIHGKMSKPHGWNFGRCACKT